MAAEHAAQILPEKCSATDSQKESPFSAVYRKIPIRCRTTLNVGISKHTHKHYTQCRPNVDSDHSVFTKVYIECNFFCLEWVVKPGPAFCIYYEGMRHPPPSILTRKKEFDLSKRKHGPTIVPALSAKVDNKKTIHSGWKLTAPLQAVPRTQHRQPVSLFLHGHGERRKEKFHSSTKGRKNGSRGKPA